MRGEQGELRRNCRGRTRLNEGKRVSDIFPVNSLFALIAPIALWLPLSGHAAIDGVDRDAANLDPKFAAATADPGKADPNRSLLDVPYAVPTQQQVRIEQRVIVRVSPRRPVARQNLMAELPQRAVPRRYEERKMEKCVPVASVAGVQTGSGNRLLLYLRDRRIVSANLEKSCRARDFYSGFYLERNKDGKLCVDRDELQSRSGAKCEIDRMRQLVPVSD